MNPRHHGFCQQSNGFESWLDFGTAGAHERPFARTRGPFVRRRLGRARSGLSMPAAAGAFSAALQPVHAEGDSIMRNRLRRLTPLTLAALLLLAPSAQAQTGIDPTLGPLTTLKDSLGFSFDLAQSKIGLHFKRPALELMMKLKYGASYQQYGATKTLVQSSAFWDGVFSALNLATIDDVREKDYIRNLDLNGALDVPNQQIPIKFDLRSKIFADYKFSAPNPLTFYPFIRVTISDQEIAQMTSDVTGTLQPKLDTATGDLFFEINNLSTSNTSTSGTFVTAVNALLFPFVLGPTTPGVSLLSLYGLTHWTNLFDGIVEDGVQAKGGATITVPQVNQVKTWVDQFCNKVFGYQGSVLTLQQPVVDAEGMWLYFTFDPVNLQQLFDDLIKKANDLGILDPINDFLTVQNQRAMAGFDLSKLNTSKKNLIISLAGAGLYLKVTAAGQPLLQTFDTTPATPLPLYADGTYRLPADYVDASTVAVVGTPWLISATGSVSSPDTFLGPDPDAFAAKIKDALALMAPNARLILLGKSMGGCKMQQVAESLKALNVNVDLLLIVDGSCTPGDQSAEVKTVSNNVERLVNFRQTMDPPANEVQNGFQLAWAKPTIGRDLVVNDEALTAPMCPGVGHEGIDECPAIFAEIDRLIKGTKVDLAGASAPQISVHTWNEAQNENNVIKPRVYVQNNGTTAVSNFKVYTYFSVEPGKTPALADWYSPGSTPTLEKLGPTNYRVVYDYAGTTVAPGEIYPHTAGSVIGLYYSPNWPVMDKSLNYSYTTGSSYVRDPLTDVQLQDGSYVFGNAHPGSSTGHGTPQEIVISANATISVPPEGVRVRVQKPTTKNGLMFTVRNIGIDTYTKVEWFGVLDQNLSNCTSRSALLSGNGMQINNIATPKTGSGEMEFVLKSQNTTTYSVAVEIFDWSNGLGCAP
jgi:hypothetical protein